MSRSRLTGVTTLALEAALVVAMCVVAVAGIIRPLIGPLGLQIGTGRYFGRVPAIPVTVSGVRIETDPVLPNLADATVQQGDGLEFTVPTGAQVSVWVPDLRQRLGFVGAPVLGGLVTIGVLVLLLLIVRTLRDGDPFVPANSRRLVAVAALVGVGGQAAVLLTAWGRLGILEHPRVAPYVVHDVPVTLWPLAAGLGVAVLAAVFRRGTQLREDVEGLV